MSNIYDVNNYTYDKLLEFMGLTNPTDRELEATINQKIIIATGPVGTGKTLFGINMGLNLF